MNRRGQRAWSKEEINKGNSVRGNISRKTAKPLTRYIFFSLKIGHKRERMHEIRSK